jgi:putative membrane protein
MNKVASITFCLLLSTPVLAQSVGEKTGVNSVMGISPTTADFIKEAAISDMFEIQSSELVEQKAVDDSATKAFAAHMIKDHSKTTSDLKSIATTDKLTADLPSQLDSDHQSKLDKLKSLNGADFIKQYHSDQAGGHKDAVSLFKRYSDGGDNPELKAWAGKMLPTLEEHLKEADDLNK